MITSDAAPFITVAELKTHLNKTSTSDDIELVLYVETACEMIRDRMGEVAAVDAVETLASSRGVLVLTHRPVLSIGIVTDVTYPVPALITGVTLESSEGIVRHPLPGRRNITINYQAGRDPVPANFKMAALELGAHLWKSSQNNTAGGRPPLGGGEQPSASGSNWALPYNVRQLLGLDKRPRQEVWIG